MPAHPLGNGAEARPARVLLLSQRGINDQIANACLYQFEDLVCRFDDVDLVSPERSMLFPGKLYKLARRFGVPRSLARSLTFRPQLDAPSDGYDLLIAVLDNYRQVPSVQAIRNWRTLADRAIAFFPEIWPKDLRTENQLLELFDVFDHVFVGVDHCVEELARMTGRPCSNLHPAVDALQACPSPNGARGIDVSYIGRRSEVTHRSLLDLATKQDFFYYYDTAKGNLRVGDHQAHRLLLSNLIKRSRYFIANYAKIDRPDQTGGQQEVGYRFFEGAAGGAVMLGEPPDTASFRRMFPWPDAVVEVPFDAPEIADVIQDLDADPERVARISDANVANSLRRHDWVYRYEEMLTAVGLVPTEAMVERRSHLEALADRFERARAASHQPSPV